MSRRLLFILLLAASGSTAHARVLLTQEQALALAFPGGGAERKTVFLTPEQRTLIESKAKAKVDSDVVTFYTGQSTNGERHYAFFDSHVVRTMPETFMAVVSTAGEVVMVEILSFYEPEDYLPPKRWLGLFRGRGLTDDLWVKRGIRNITGATITTQAITAGVRRAIATYEVAVKDRP